VALTLTLPLRAGEKEQDMERRKRPYSIHKRPAVNHRHIYYARFRDETGACLTAVSTGCTRIDDAVRWCESHLATEGRDNITLAEYARGFWEPSAPFATDRAAHGGPGNGTVGQRDSRCR